MVNAPTAPVKRYGMSAQQRSEGVEQKRFELFKMLVAELANTKPAAERIKSAARWLQLYNEIV